MRLSDLRCINFTSAANPNRLFLATLVSCFFVALGSCSALVPVSPVDPPLAPSVQTLATQPQSSTADADSDYKLRERARERIRILILEANEGEAARRVAFLKARLLISAADVQVIEPPENVRDALLGDSFASSLDFLRDNQVDGIAHLTFDESADSDGSDSLVMSLIDPVKGTPIADARLALTLRSPSIDGNHHAEMYRAGGRYFFLDPASSRIVEFPEDARSNVRALIEKSVTGQLTIQSTAPDTKVSIAQGDNGESLGETPILGRTMREGKYTIKLERLGHETQSREVWVRAGETRTVFATWPDDEDVTALALLSAPPGHRISIDGIVRGMAPIYITDIDPGSYEVEASRAAEGSSAHGVMGRETVNVDSGKLSGLLFWTNYKEDFAGDLLDTDYWNLVAEEGSLSQAEGEGLRLMATSNAPVWVGIVSRPVQLAAFEATLNVVQADDRAMMVGFRGENESLFVHIQGSTYTAIHYKDGERQGEITSYRPKATGPEHVIGFEYDPEDGGEFEMSVDGTDVFEAPMDLSALGNPRFAILTRSTDADGSMLARSLWFRSGPGRYED